METSVKPFSNNPAYIAALKNAQAYKIIETPPQPEIIITPNTTSQDFLSWKNVLIILGIMGAVGLVVYAKNQYDKKQNESTSNSTSSK